MASVVDAFIIELSLDPSKFDAQQKKAVASFKSSQDELESRAKNTEKAADGAGSSIAGLARQASGLFASVGAGKFLVDLTTQTLTAASGVNRLSRSIGVGSETITKWQGLARIFGGDAASMASSFTTLSDAFAGWKIGIISPMVADFRAISTAGGKIIDVNKGVEQSLLDLADNLRNIANSGPDGPAQAGLLGRRLGLDPATIDMMLQGGDKLKALLGDIKGMTNEETRAAAELERQWNSLTNSIGNWARSGILKYVSSATTTVAELKRGEIVSKDSLLGSWMYGTKFRGFGPQGPTFLPSENPLSATPVGSQKTGAFRSQDEKAAFIQDVAKRNGIDPEVALRVSKTEGFGSYVGDRNSSFGAFQLHYGGVAPGMMQGGLGDRFTKQTGLDARDPATEKQQIEFALKYAATSGRGWADWYGARNNGIGQYAGIGQGGANTTTQNVTVENLTVNVPAGSNGQEVGEAARAALNRRTSAAANANSGGQ